MASTPVSIRERVLVVDDEPIVRFGIREFLETQGFEVAETSSAAGARTAFGQFRPDVAVLDYALPDGNALDLLEELRQADPEVPLILLTGHGSIDLAVRAIKRGAENFVTKPVELSALQVILERALEHRRIRRRQAAQSSRQAREETDPFLGESAAIRALAQEAALAVRSGGPVLILGETGSGKGVLARWIRSAGARRDEPFVDLNCAGLGREFLESELFGHARGAFTGAVADKKGLFEVAHRGTLFLDEVGDLDPAVQPKVLKAIEEKRFRRMGEVQERQVDVFLIAATNHDLPRLVREGKFRSDLYFRISTFPLAVPPLRARLEDIPVLAQGLLRALGRDLGRPALRLSADALAVLCGYAWPGNVRELRNVLERAALRGAGEELRAADLRFGSDIAPAAPPDEGGLSLPELERRQIERALREEKGNVERAASRLGISRSTLYQKIKEYRLDLGALQS